MLEVLCKEHLVAAGGVPEETQLVALDRVPCVQYPLLYQAVAAYPVR